MQIERDNRGKIIVTQDIIDYIEKEYLNNKSTREIAEKLGVYKMSANDVICSGAKMCNSTNNKYCSCRFPHIFNHEECSGFTCPIIMKWVECRSIYAKIKYED